MPMPPLDPFGPADTTWDPATPEPASAVPVRQPVQPPVVQPEPVAPQVAQRPEERPPRYDRLTAIKALLHLNEQTCSSAYHLGALLNFGWQAEEHDTKVARVQLSDALRELTTAARRISSVTYMLQSQGQK